MSTEYHKRKIYEAITRFNYFPNQKKDSSEIPTCISSKRFTPEVVEELNKLPYNNDGRQKSGFDLVEFYVTRHNNIPRALGIPHPFAYAYLAKTIIDQWDRFAHIETNGLSKIKPTVADRNRIFVMNYENPEEKTHNFLDISFGKEFRIETDISNCFHSIYSHAIPWALVGIDESKKNTEFKHWFNKIDTYQRKLKRNETIGIPIGPATSSIIVEILLSKIDKVLNDKGFYFFRYIDDYICYCETYEEALDFTNHLGKELRDIKLTLNINKTVIKELPEPLIDNWVTSLLSHLPSSYINNDGDKRNLTFKEVVSFLDAATVLKKETPGGSVLKYAVSIIDNSISEDLYPTYVKYLVNLCWHYPILLPHLEKLFDNDNVDPKD